MRLTELEPEFVKLTSADGSTWRSDATFQDNDGLLFLCPKCWLANAGPVGTHSVLCWKPHVDPSIEPKPGRWAQTGTGLEDLSLVAGSSSVKLEGGCNWHGYVTKGEVTILPA